MQRWYWNRWLVYPLLAPLCALSLLDALPQHLLLHTRLQQAIDPVLDVTGLWQGSWMLFAPSPDHLNARIGAQVDWSDETQSTWHPPAWHELPRWEKVRAFRHMEYFDSLWRSYNQPAWPAFCQHLAARLDSDPDRSVTRILLFVDHDVIAPPDEEWRPAYAPPRYTEQEDLHEWRADE